MSLYRCPYRLCDFQSDDPEDVDDHVEEEHKVGRAKEKMSGA